MKGYCKILVMGKVYNLKKVEGKTGTPIALFNVGTFKYSKDGDKAQFHPLVIYGKSAEAFLNVVKDGTNMFFECEPDYFQKESGDVKTQYVVRDWQFTAGKES